MSDFVMKDSGKRETFSSGAVRDSRSGKGRFDLISPLFLRRLAVVMERGAEKYAARNWEKGMPIDRLLDSACRHINDYLSGKRDEDHLAQAGFNIMAACHFDELGFTMEDPPILRRADTPLPSPFEHLADRLL